MGKMIEVPTPQFENGVFEGTFKVVSGELQWCTLTYSPEESSQAAERVHWDAAKLVKEAVAKEDAKTLDFLVKAEDGFGDAVKALLPAYIEETERE